MQKEISNKIPPIRFFTEEKIYELIQESSRNTDSEKDSNLRPRFSQSGIPIELFESFGVR